MTREMDELEQDIAKSRARLDQTIDRLQRRLTVSGVVDDALGVVRETPYAPYYDRALSTIRNNPVPVLLVTAGIGLLLQRLTREARKPDRVDMASPAVDATMDEIRDELKHVGQVSRRSDLDPLKGDTP